MKRCSKNLIHTSIGNTQILLTNIWTYSLNVEKSFGLTKSLAHLTSTFTCNDSYQALWHEKDLSFFPKDDLTHSCKWGTFDSAKGFFLASVLVFIINQQDFLEFRKARWLLKKYSNRKYPMKSKLSKELGISWFVGVDFADFLMYKTFW